MNPQFKTLNVVNIVQTLAKDEYTNHQQHTDSGLFHGAEQYLALYSFMQVVHSSNASVFPL